MWKPISFAILVLCFVFVNGSLNSSEFLKEVELDDVLWASSPGELSNAIEKQLARNDSRFISRRCFRHLTEYYRNLFGLKFWAVKMFDSSAKIPSGLLRGFGAALGSFDQCLKVEHQSDKVGKIHGKYCLRRFQVYNDDKFIFSRQAFRDVESQQSRLLDVSKASVSLPWATCLPDACSAKDFQFLPLFRFSDEYCQTKESEHKELDGGDVAAISVLGVIAGLIIISTVYDLIVRYGTKGPGTNVLKSFSIYTNGLKIITLKEDPEDEISCIYGLRVLSMISVMFGFRYAMFAFAPLVNWLEILAWLLNRNKSSVLEAVICGDTFFVISGLLVSYNYLKAKEQGIRFNVLVYYLRRLIRLTPALGVTILIHATLLRHLGSGPVWPTTRDSWLVNNCKEFWWTSLLYVQNYVNSDFTKICILQTWHLSVDMQLFLLSPLLLIPLGKNPKYTLGTVGFLLLCAIVSPFLATWVYDIKAILATTRSMGDLKNYMTNFYFPLHTRAASWIIGFLMGYYLHETKKPSMRLIVEKKLRSNKLVVLLLWALALSSILFCIMIGREMIGKTYNWVSNAFHIALIRPLWSLAISWIIFACAHGYGGPINSILSISAFQVVSRITYCTFLINISLMFVLTYQTRVGLEFGDFDAIYRVCGDVFFSLGLGFVWTLAFESPFMVIGNILFGPWKKATVEIQQRKDSNLGAVKVK